MAKNLPKATVVDRRDLTADMFILKLRPPTPVTFVPGQYCTLGIDGFLRPYSIVSAPHEEAIELVVEHIPEPDGKLTPRLHQLREGDEVGLAPKCKGTFTFDPSRPNQVFIATATGIAPFVSYLRDYFYNGRSEHRFTVLMGASYRDELCYADELADMAQRYPFVRFIPTVSRPDEARNAGWDRDTGRVNTIVGHYLERFALEPEDSLLYVCGNPGMIADVRERFEPAGYTLREEKFWQEPKP